METNKQEQVNVQLDDRSAPNHSIKDGEVVFQQGNAEDFNIEITPEEDRRLVKRIDLMLLPILTITYSLQYIDKNTLVDAAVLGLPEDLDLVNQEYSWAGSIFYFGYLVACYPLSYLMVRLPIGKVLAATMVGWATVLLCTAAVQNAAGILTVRFLLGVAESAIAPGFNLVTAMWYKRSEQTTRISAWFLGNSIGGFLGSLLFYGVGHLQTFVAWRAGFLIVGSINMLWGVLMLLYFPDTQMSAVFLKPEDRSKAVARVRENQTGIKNNKFKPKQAFGCLLDPLCWILVLMQVTAAIPNGGITNFSSLIIQGIGFSRLNSLLLKLGAFGFQILFIGIGVLGTRYFHNSRIYFVLVFNVVCIAGGLVIRLTPLDQIWTRYFGVCLIMAFAASVPMKMSLMSANLGGFTRKATVNAMSFIGYCVGNIIGPQMFRQSEAPVYPSGFVGMVVCWVAVFIQAVLLLFWFKWENHRRDKIESAPDYVPPLMEDGSGSLTDLTDKENMSFRYIY